MSATDGHMFLDELQDGDVVARNSWGSSWGAEPGEEPNELELLILYGRAREALFRTNEAWLQGGKPDAGPLAAERHGAQTEHSVALAALNVRADALLEWFKREQGFLKGEGR